MNVRLYPLVVLCVLLATGCAEDDRGDRGDRPAAPAGPQESARVETPSADVPAGRTTVLVLGNSITAGLGVAGEQAFPALLQQKVDSVGWDVEVVNAGLSGETSAGGLRRIDWLLRREVDVLVLELGGNDGLRGIEPEVTRENLQAIIDKTRAAYPDARIVIAGMQLPPNLGPDYTRRFREIFPALAEANDAALIPFVLEGVGGVPSRMQNDGIHPNAAGHRVVARNVWDVLAPLLAEITRPA